MPDAQSSLIIFSTSVERAGRLKQPPVRFSQTMEGMISPADVNVTLVGYQITGAFSVSGVDFRSLTDGARCSCWPHELRGLWETARHTPDANTVSVDARGALQVCPRAFKWFVPLKILSAGIPFHPGRTALQARHSPPASTWLSSARSETARLSAQEWATSASARRSRCAWAR